MELLVVLIIPMFGWCSTLRSVFLVLMFLTSFSWNLGLTRLQLGLMSLDFIGGDPSECHNGCWSWCRALSGSKRSCSCVLGKKNGWVMNPCLIVSAGLHRRGRNWHIVNGWGPSLVLIGWSSGWPNVMLMLVMVLLGFGFLSFVEISFNLHPLHMPDRHRWAVTSYKVTVTSSYFCKFVTVTTSHFKNVTCICNGRENLESNW